METGNSRQLKVGILLSYGQIFLNVLIQLVYTPLLIRFLGQSEYGLYNVIASTIQILSILNLGFNGGYIKFFTRYKKENNQEAISKLNGLFVIIFSILGLVAFICGLFLAFRMDLVFDEGLTAGEYGIARWLMLLFTLNMAISFPATVLICIISAHEKFIVLKALGMIKTVFAPILTIPFLLLGKGSIAVVSVTVLISIVTDLLYLYFVMAKLKTKFVFHNFEKGLFSELLVFTSFIALNLIVDQVNSNMGKILLGRFKGTDVAAIYSVGYTLYQFYVLFSTSISGVFAPKVHALIKDTEETPLLQRKELTSLFVQVGRMQFIILGLVELGFLFFGKQFIFLWAGKEYGEAYYVMLLLAVPATIPLIQNIGLDIQRAQNRHYFRSIAYIIMALVNVVVTVVLCQRFGATGAAVGTAVSMIVANGFIMNIYYHKRCNINILIFWRSIARLSLGMLIPVAFGVVVLLFVDQTKILFFGLGVLSFVIVYGVSMWFFGINQSEKEFIKKALKRLKKHA